MKKILIDLDKENVEEGTQIKSLCKFRGKLYGMKTGYIKLRANHGARKPPEMWFPVQVIRERKSFGRVDYLITPIGGSGEAWVQSNRFKEEIYEQPAAKPPDYIDNGGIGSDPER